MNPGRPPQVVARLLAAGLAAGLLVAATASARTPEEAMAGRLATLREHGWTVAHSLGKLLILSRTVPGSAAREARALTVAPTPPARLMAVVTAYADYPTFVPYVARSEVLPSPDGITRVFQRVDLPLPLRDRQFTVRLTPFHSPHDGSIGLSWTLDGSPAFQRDDSGIRPLVYEGSWTFTPLEDGASALLEYFVRADPGGWVPGWAVDLGLRHALPKMVDTIIQRAAAPPDPSERE